MTPLQSLIKDREAKAEEFIHRAIKLPENGQVDTKRLFALIDDHASFNRTTIRKMLETVREMFEGQRERFKCGACDGAKCEHAMFCVCLSALSAHLTEELDKIL